MCHTFLNAVMASRRPYVLFVILLTFLDENLKISLLPHYVADGPDSMPSARLYDGDLAVLMKVIDRLESEVKSLSTAMAAMIKDIGQSWRSSTQPAPPVVRSVINNDPVIGFDSRAQRGNVGGAGNVMTSGDSHRQPGYPQSVQLESTSQAWADIAASTPIVMHNRFAALATDDDDDDRGRGSFIEQRPRLLAKRSAIILQRKNDSINNNVSVRRRHETCSSSHSSSSRIKVFDDVDVVV